LLPSAILKAYKNQDRDDWDFQLPAVLCAYRKITRESTSESPYKMAYSWDITLPRDILYGEFAVDMSSNERPHK
jgi:hypothetical protein